MKKFVFISSLVFFLASALNVYADSVGEKRSFYIEPSFDLAGREKITAVLAKVTPRVYFYVDENWWNFTLQNEIYSALSDLGDEFDTNIYSVLTSAFGPEWNPGIDKESKITVLIHPMKEEAGGYFSSKDEYSNFQITTSNQREMVYLNSEYIKTSLAKSFLAHEFVHLITFNQKENSYDVTDETWLNEARAEYASTLVGYDDNYAGSNLERKAQILSNNPFDSLIDWQSRKEDYGTINLFAQYLVDHYGIKILADSLHSSKIGIDSINYALKKNGFKENFSQIFLDWTIAVLINDCNYGPKYCYLNKNLTNFYITPRTNFLPLTGKSTLSVVDTTKSWAGNWYKVIGGRGNLRLEFISSSSQYFTVPYIIKSKSGGYIVDFLNLSKSQKGEIFIDNFSQKIASLFIIPIVNKPDSQAFYSFSWSVSIEESQEESALITSLLAKIEELTQQIAKIQSKIAAILNGGQIAGANHNNCLINNNLYYGLTNNQEVRCLQEFLKSQGTYIYPQGLITGNFLSLTKEAVIRFQEKYASDILAPLGLENGNGYVGKNTRSKINKILGRY